MYHCAGQSTSSAIPFVIGHAVRRDAHQIPPRIAAAKRRARRPESDARGASDPISCSRAGHIFAKAELPRMAACRGFRHTMLDDTDISCPPGTPVAASAR